MSSQGDAVPKDDPNELQPLRTAVAAIALGPVFGPMLVAGLVVDMLSRARTLAEGAGAVRGRTLAELDARLKELEARVPEIRLAKIESMLGEVLERLPPKPTAS
jgi:hypothetical protein